MLQHSSEKAHITFCDQVQLPSAPFLPNTHTWYSTNNDNYFLSAGAILSLLILAWGSSTALLTVEGHPSNPIETSLLPEAFLDPHPPHAFMNSQPCNLPPFHSSPTPSRLCHTVHVKETHEVSCAELRAHLSNGGTRKTLRSENSSKPLDKLQKNIIVQRGDFKSHLDNLVT